MGMEKWLQADDVLAFCKLLLQFALVVPHIKKKREREKKSKCLLYHKNARRLFMNVSQGRDPRINSPMNLSSRELQLW